MAKRRADKWDRPPREPDPSGVADAEDAYSAKFGTPPPWLEGLGDYREDDGSISGEEVEREYVALMMQAVDSGEPVNPIPCEVVEVAGDG